MTTTYTPQIGLTLLGDGDAVDTWGQSQDANMTRISEATDGILVLSVSGSRSLVDATDATDEGHFAIINITAGTGGTVVLPLKPGQYVVRNGASADVTFKNAAVSPTANAILHSGTTSLIFNDGVSNVYQLGFGGNLRDYIDAILPAAKAYTDASSFAASSGSFPGQATNAGKYLQTNGTNPAWVQPVIADITGLQTQLNLLASRNRRYFAKL